MTDYERELMANGTYLIKMQEVYPTPYIPNEPRIKVSPTPSLTGYTRKIGKGNEKDNV